MQRQPQPYESSGAGVRTLEVLAGASRYNRWIYSRLRSGIGRRVLEVGSGTGTITELLQDRELVVGVDVVDDFIADLRNRFAGPNFHFLVCDLSKEADGLQEYRFDSAVTVNVLEHIEDDYGTIATVYRLLEPGGTFAILVPAHPALLGPFDRAIGHYRRYTKAALRSKLERAGFVIEEIRYSNPVGALGWLVNVKLLRRDQLGGVGLYDRLVPVLARVDRLSWPFGLNLIAIARKPAAAGAA